MNTIHSEMNYIVEITNFGKLLQKIYFDINEYNGYLVSRLRWEFNDVA